MPINPNEAEADKLLRRSLHNLKRAQIIDLATKYAPPEMLAEVILIGQSGGERRAGLHVAQQNALTFNADFDTYGEIDASLSAALRGLRPYWSYFPNEVMTTYVEVAQLIAENIESGSWYDRMEDVWMEPGWRIEVDGFLATLNETNHKEALSRVQRLGEVLEWIGIYDGYP